MVDFITSSLLSAAQNQFATGKYKTGTTQDSQKTGGTQPSGTSVLALGADNLTQKNNTDFLFGGKFGSNEAFVAVAEAGADNGTNTVTGSNTQATQNSFNVFQSGPSSAQNKLQELLGDLEKISQSLDSQQQNQQDTGTLFDELS